MRGVPYKSEMSPTWGHLPNPDDMNLDYENRRVDVEQGRNFLISSQWSVPLTYARGPNNENGPQGTYHNPLSVNRLVDVEHLWTQPIRSQWCKPNVDHKEACH